MKLTSTLALTVLKFDALPGSSFVTLWVGDHSALGHAFSVSASRVPHILITGTLALRPLRPFWPLWTIGLKLTVNSINERKLQTFGTNRRGDFWGTDFKLTISPTNFAVPKTDLAASMLLLSSVKVIVTSSDSSSRQGRLSKFQEDFLYDELRAVSFEM